MWTPPGAHGMYGPWLPLSQSLGELASWRTVGILGNGSDWRQAALRPPACPSPLGPLPQRRCRGRPDGPTAVAVVGEQPGRVGAHAALRGEVSSELRRPRQALDERLRAAGRGAVSHRGRKPELDGQPDGGGVTPASWRDLGA